LLFLKVIITQMPVLVAVVSITVKIALSFGYQA